jgi:DNA repair protein RadC
MSKRSFTCRDCHGYAPADGQGRPMWPGPRCTRCAAQRYIERTGCDPAQAELLMLAERSQNRASSRPSSAPAVHETAASYATQPPLMSVPYPPPLAPAVLPLRERPVYRVANHSDACSLIELLTVLIGGPRAGTTAQALLAHYGTALQIANAPAAELTHAVPGLSETLAARLKAAAEFGRRLTTKTVDQPEIRSPADAAALLMSRMSTLEQEYLYVLLLNTRNRLIGDPREVYHGSLNTSLIRNAEVFRDAVRVNAAAIIVAHNHPSGDPSPSIEDQAVTRSLVETGKLLDIELLDHLVIGNGGRFISLKERGLGFNK